MRRGKTAGVAALFTFALLGFAACGDAPSAELRAAIAEGCAIDSECSSPLVCAFRACHVQCETSRDCERYGKANCVQSDKPYRVCQLPNETKCQRNSDCPGAQICGADARCRDACLVDRDCGSGQLCVSKTCAEKDELIDDKLPGAPPPVVGSACLRPSDCGSDLVCKFGTCTVECVTAKDCDIGLACIDTRCGVPNVGGAGGRAGSGGSSAGAAGTAGKAGAAGQAGQGGSAGQAGTGGAGQGGSAGQSGAAGQSGNAGQGGAGGQAGVGGQAGAGGGTCVQDAPCDTGNACELGKTDCSTSAPACVSAGLKPASTVCRAAAGICDAAESCDGKTPTCPPDARKSAGTECRATAGDCDLAEVCDGTTNDCPSDALRPNDFACRPSVGDCDAEEKCTGTDPVCPTDGRLGAGTVCRVSAGDCDAEETCDGAAAACPDDSLRPNGFTCRAAASSCDVAEVCSGSSDTCPIDAFVSIGNACTGGFCDGLGTCSNTCTPNAPCSTGNPCELGTTDCSSGVPKCVATGPGNAGTVCRAAAGPCDVEDTCSGSSTTCPDVKLGSGATCRPSTGPCDVAETCNGSAVTCPDDAFEPASKVCRTAVAGGCDVAETCTGTTAACPNDAFAPATTVCRASAGFCDVAENCTGSTGTCPNDTFKPATQECRATAGACDLAENCTGSAAACPPDVLAGSNVVCRAAANECDVPESCGSAGAACPANGFQPVGTDCATGECDAIGVCAIEQDCTHRWRVPTIITGNISLASSDRSAVVCGQSGIGARGEGYKEADGSSAWSRALVGSFNGRGNTRYGIYIDTSGSSETIGVHDLYDGSTVTSFGYSNNTNFGRTITQSAANQTATQSLVVATAFSAAPWATTAGGVAISGMGPAALLVSHAADGKYQRHLQYASSAGVSVTPTALYDGRWAIPIRQPSVALTFGASHTVPAGTNELLILKEDLSFDRAHPIAFAPLPSAFAVVIGSNLRVVSNGGALAAYNDAGLAWSRADCGGSYLSASATQLFVAQNATGTFCGRPVPSGLGSGMGVAVLDAATGNTLSVRWFPTSAPATFGSIAADGDAYFLYGANTTVCGASNASISVVAY